MQVILYKNVENVGLPGEIANVKPGYYRNYLGPRRLAEPVSPGAMKRLEERRAKLEKEAGEIRLAAKEMGVRMQAVPIKFVEKNSETGRLFGSVTTADIAAKLSEMGFKVDRRQVAMPQTIKQIGTYTASIKLHAGASTQVTVIVDPETPLPEKEAMPEAIEEDAEEGEGGETGEGEKQAESGGETSSEA
jgi:large subunit ribosomal protein L9